MSPARKRQRDRSPRITWDCQWTSSDDNLSTTSQSILAVVICSFKWEGVEAGCGPYSVSR
jgi:hypothetical protein